MLGQIVQVGLIGAVIMLAIVAATLWLCNSAAAKRIEALETDAKLLKAHREVDAEYFDRIAGAATQAILRTDLLADDDGDEFAWTDPVPEKHKIVPSIPSKLVLRPKPKKQPVA